MELAQACTWLFVPGDRPERFSKAAVSGADVVIVDLEDAVDHERKAFARRATVEALEGGARFAVRVNAPGTTDLADDLAGLAATSARPLAVIVAKAEEAGDLSRITELLDCPVIPLVESAKGLMAARLLASATSVVRLAFGAVDYSLDISATADDHTLAYARSYLVAASRAAGIAAPLDTPSLHISDTDAVADAARLAKRFGMGGKLCIHPAQVAVVAKAFAPTAAEIEQARGVLAAASDDGAASYQGQMIDRPVLERARQLLILAGVAA